MTSQEIQKLVEQLWTVHDLCERFDRTPMTIHLWRRRGLPAIIIKGRERDTVRFHPGDVQGWARREGIEFKKLRRNCRVDA